MDRLIFYYSFSFLCGVLSFFPSGIKAQKEKITLHMEDNQVIDVSEETPVQYLNGNVQIYHAGSYMYCDRAVLREQVLRMYDNVSMLQNDTIRIFADSLIYNGDSLVAHIYGKIIFENGPSRTLYTEYMHYDASSKVATYTQKGRLVDNTSELVSQKGRYFLNDQVAFFYEKVMATDTEENFLLMADSIQYDLSTNISTFLSEVRISKDSQQIYSESGWFDLNQKKGDFTGQAHYQEGSLVARADTISYNGDEDTVILKSKDTRSVYYNEKDTALAYTIYFNQSLGDFRLTGDGYYKGEKNEVSGEDIFYNKNTAKFKVNGRSRVSDPPFIIEADTLDYDKNAKMAQADGHVIWRDTSTQTAILADHIIYEGEQNKMLATNDKDRPLFISDIEGDSLFMKADTLRSLRIIRERILYPDADALRKARLMKIKSDTLSVNNDSLISLGPVLSPVAPDTSMSADVNVNSLRDSTAITLILDTIYTGIMDTLDYLVGQKNVRLFKNDFQAVCDSLVYSSTDSLFQLFGLPYMWSDSSQIAGDTIDILLRDNKMDKLRVKNNALILSTRDEEFFNQIQGRFMEGFFEKNKLKRLDVDGNAQVLYYLTDDSDAYLGINKTEASRISFDFDDNNVISIRNYVEPRSKVLPMKTTDHNQIKVKGFLWNTDKRPQSPGDL